MQYLSLKNNQQIFPTLRKTTYTKEVFFLFLDLFQLFLFTLQTDMSSRDLISLAI